MTAAGVSEEEEILGSTEEEEAEATPDVVAQQGVSNPVEETGMRATTVKLTEGHEERLEVLPTASSTEMCQEGLHKVGSLPGLLEGFQAEAERTPSNSVGWPPKEEFDRGGLDSQHEMGTCGAPLSKVKLEGQDAIESNYIAVEATEEEQCKNRRNLVGFSKSPSELRSEEDAQTAPASPNNLHLSQTMCVKMTPMENDPLFPAGLTMVAEDEEAQSAPASPMKVVPCPVVGSPVKVSLLASNPINSGSLPSAEHSQSSLARALNVQEKKKDFPVLSGHVKLSAEEEEEEAEMAPGSPINYASNVNVFEEEKEVAPVNSVTPVTIFMEPVQTLLVAEEEAEMAPISPVKLLTDKKKEWFSSSPTNMASADKISFSTVSPVNQMTFDRVDLAKKDESIHFCHDPLLRPATAVVSSTFSNPIKMAVNKEEMPTGHFSFISEGQDRKDSACHLKMESENSGPQMPKKGTKEVVMQSSSIYIMDKSLKESLQTRRLSGDMYLQTDSSHKKLTAEGMILPASGNSTELVNDGETLSSQSYLQMKNQGKNVLEALVSPLKTGALNFTVIPMAPAQSHDLKAQDNPFALASPKKLSVEVELGNNELLNKSIEVVPEQLLTSPKKPRVWTFSQAVGSPHTVLEIKNTHALTSPQNCKGQEGQETAITPNKHPAEELSESLTRSKKHACEKVPDVPVSLNLKVAQKMQSPDTFQFIAPMEATANSSKEVIKENHQCRIVFKRQFSEKPEVLHNTNKHIMEERTESLASLRKSRLEEEQEMLDSHMTTEDDQEAETAPENVSVGDDLAVGESSQNQTAKSQPEYCGSSKKLVITEVWKSEVAAAATPSLHKKVAEDSSLLKAISGSQMNVGSFNTPLLPVKHEQGRWKDFTDLKVQVSEEDPLVPFVSEEQAEDGTLVPSASEEQAPEDGPLVASVSEDDQQMLSGPLTSVTSKGFGESIRTVMDGTPACGVETTPETDTTDEQEDCAQEYPGSPMDLDDDESTNTSENLVVGMTSSVFTTGQGLKATADSTINQQHSVATEVCNGTDTGTGTSAYTSYFNHGPALCPGIETDDGSFQHSVEFDKRWKPTQENPFDFTLWTDLLDYVDKENNILASRKAYNAFFTRYPYCYGYWKKYADMERRFGYLKEAEQVFEHGVQSIPLSVDLWIHFITFLQEAADMTQMESIQRISNGFEMALAAAGMEFHSDNLWEMYADWAKTQGDLQAITVIYDRILSTPTHLYSHHFEKFKEHVSSNSPVDILSKEEYMWLKSKLMPEATSAAVSMGSGDQVQGHEGSEEAAQVAEITSQSEVDLQKMRELIISLREQMYKQNEAEVSKRWTFEEAIKRPYFHVKPLERAELINWRDYLDFEISNGSHARTIVLFERCVIACALYEEFWLKYTKYLESHTVIGTRSVFQRSCLYHLPRKPNLHLLWAAFEEKQGDVQEARNILKRLDEAVPGLAMVCLRRVSLERRVGNLEAAEALLREAVLINEGTPLATFYSIKLARQVLKVQNNRSKAREVLQEALEKDPENAKLYLNLLEMEFSADVNLNERNTINCIQRVLRSNLPADTKVVFSQRRMEYLEDFGSNIKSLLTAYDDHQKLLKLLAPKRKVTENGSADEPEEKKIKTEEIAAQPVITSATSTALVGGDVGATQVATSAAYNYNTWYQNYGAYNYPNTWNYNYYPQS